MIKLLVIAPYSGLVELFKQVIPEVPEFDITIKIGNLYEGVEEAKDAEAAGYDVIISRGGTATLIQEVVSLPVIDIQVSGYDILRILTLVKGFSGKAAIVAFPNISLGASTICSILDLDIVTITISSDDEVDAKLRELKQTGYEVVIGDVITTEAAKRLGLNGILITSGKEAVIEALEEAKRILSLFSRMNEDVSLLKSILDEDDRAVAVIDKNMDFMYKNKMFSKEFKDVNLRKLPELVSFLEDSSNKKSKMNRSFEVDGQLWRVTATPVKNDNLALFFDRLAENNFVKGMQESTAAIELLPQVPFETIFGQHESTQKVIRQINEYANINAPVWIIAEDGNGKELIAKSIYLARSDVEDPFVILHCHLLKKNELKGLMKEGFFHRYQSTIYVRNIDSLSFEDQKLLLSFLKQNEGIKWIASSTEKIDEKMEAGTFIRDLYNLLARFVIYQPPLRERPEDIKNLVHLFISDYHLKYGKQIVGIREEALNELLDYNWPGNVEELKQTVEQLVLETQTYFIEKVDIEAVIKQLKRKRTGRQIKNYVLLEGSLEKIEKEIIQKVLEEEDMNQSKAAKRLGINRSTLWRKLK